MQITTVITNPDDAGQRLDKCLAQHLPGHSRSRVQQWLAQGCVRLGAGTITDAGRKVKSGEQYEITIPEATQSHLVASEIPLAIIYEDKHLLIINKQPGLTVHPAPGHADDTLVNALLTHCGNSLSGIGGVMRPGIVHRIDKDTSGLLVVAKHDKAHKHLSEQLAERTLKREYICFVKGLVNVPQATIEANIARSVTNRKKMAVVKSGGRNAITHYKVTERFAAVPASLLRCQLETGRTHQIRVHLAHIGHPIIGDPVYGRKLKEIEFPRQALHAARLNLVHPETGQEMEFNAPLPEDMEALLVTLRSAG